MRLGQRPGRKGRPRNFEGVADLGEELHSPAILGSGHEISVWMALTQGDLSGVLAGVDVGLAAAKDAPVPAQLHAQAAKAWARIGGPD